MPWSILSFHLDDLAMNLLEQLRRCLARSLALWILRAAEEVVAAEEAELHRLAAVGAGVGDLDLRHLLLCRHRREHALDLFLHLLGDLLGTAALRIGTAAEEWTAWAAFHHHR